MRPRPSPRPCGGKHKPVFASWLGSDTAEEAHAIFAGAGIPAYDTPDKAIRGFSYLVGYNRGQKNLMEVPPSLPEDFTPDEAAARKIIDAALEKGDGWLDEPDVHALLDAYGIANVRSKIVHSDAEAASYAQKLGGKVALKIFSPDITHKSDVGGVVLNLESPDAVLEAAEAMRARVARLAPKARIEGFIVQEMVQRPDARELILGMAVDRQFGPFLLFGRGGTAAEVIADRALALPPLNLTLAHEMMSRTRVWKQLLGYRDVPPRRYRCDRADAGAAVAARRRFRRDLPSSTSIRCWPMPTASSRWMRACAWRRTQADASEPALLHLALSQGARTCRACGGHGRNAAAPHQAGRRAGAGAYVRAAFCPKTFACASSRRCASCRRACSRG